MSYDYGRPHFVVKWYKCDYIGTLRNVGDNWEETEILVGDYFRARGHNVVDVGGSAPIDFYIDGVAVDAKWVSRYSSRSFNLFTSNAQVNALGMDGYYVIVRSDRKMFRLSVEDFKDGRTDR